MSELNGVVLKAKGVVETRLNGWLDDDCENVVCKGVRLACKVGNSGISLRVSGKLGCEQGANIDSTFKQAFSPFNPICFTQRGTKARFQRFILPSWS